MAACILMPAISRPPSSIMLFDVVDMVVLDHRENAAHAPDDAALLAVVDVAPADDVAAHVLLQPAVVLPAADGIPLHLGGGFDVLSGEVVVVVRSQYLPREIPAHLELEISQSSMIQPLGPVRTDHAVLVGGGRGPGGVAALVMQNPLTVM